MDSRRVSRSMDSFSRILKSGLAFLLENERDVDAGFGLDVRVAVMEGETQQTREMPPDGRLARTHRSDQKDVALGEHDRR